MPAAERSRISVRFGDRPDTLDFVRCAVMFGLFYGMKDLHFEVPGGGKSTYLGDIEIRLSQNEDEAEKMMAKAKELKGLMGVASLEGPGMVKDDEDDFVLIHNQLQAASREYQARFGKNPDVVVTTD